VDESTARRSGEEDTADLDDWTFTRSKTKEGLLFGVIDYMYRWKLPK